MWQVRRRIFFLASLLSQLLCLATAVLWVQSYYGGIEIKEGFDPSVFRLDRSGFRTERGELELAGPERVIFFHLSPTDWPETGLASSYTNRFGFGYLPPDELFGERVAMPIWPLTFVAAVLPSLWLLIRFRSRLQIGDRCRQCSYNLTGNTSGTCPECGTAIPQSSRPA